MAKGTVLEPLLGLTLLLCSDGRVGFFDVDVVAANAALVLADGTLVNHQLVATNQTIWGNRNNLPIQGNHTVMSFSFPSKKELL